MIFSEAKWADEFKTIVKVSKALSYNSMLVPLTNAYNLFIVPLLGDSLIAKIEEIYAKVDPSAVEQELISLVQRATANLALWYDFSEINLRITDSGFQRQDTESFKTLYKYQENDLRQGFKNKGFNALDWMLSFFEKHIDDYPEYKTSSAYLDSSKALVKTTEELNSVYFINGSRIIFLRLQTHLKFAESTKLQPALGDILYEKLREMIENPPTDETEKRNAETLRLKSAKVVIMEAVKRLLKETGSITDRGLYFSSIEAKYQSDESFQPVEIDRIAVQVEQARCDTEIFQTELMKFVRRTYPEYYQGNQQRVFDRDNDHKKTFWA